MPHSPTPPVALVTGGAVRVGRQIVLTLAERGYSVAIHANRSTDKAEALAAELKERGTEALVVSANLSDADATRAMVDRAFDHFGHVDLVVNNAAIWSPKPLEDVTSDDVLDYFKINALAPFIICQQAGLRMARQASGGAIVNIGDWAVERPYLDYSAYFPSKGTIPTITRLFAVELSHRNPRVRVNAILPGPVMLPEDLSEAEREEAIDTTLVKQEGTPQSVADAVVFLAENPFITGACLPVDGGRTIA